MSKMYMLLYKSNEVIDIEFKRNETSRNMFF